MPATKRILHAINNNGMAPVILSPQTNVYNITQQGRGGGYSQWGRVMILQCAVNCFADDEYHMPVIRVHQQHHHRHCILLHQH